MNLENLKKNRKSIRRVCTTSINYLDSNILSLNKVELRAQVEILEAYYDKNSKLDEEIKSLLLQDESVSENEIDKFEDECNKYYLKIKICQNQLKERIEILCRENGGRSGGDNVGTAVNAQGRNRLNLPNLDLPEFFADQSKDSMTCSNFFKNFELLLAGYNLNEIELYKMLERQCKGRANAMISSIDVCNKNFTFAKKLLLKSFGEEKPLKFSIIKQLTELKLVWGKDDPYLYYSKFEKIINSFDELKIDTKEVLLYFIWGGLPIKFQDIIVNILNKSFPELENLREKFLDACTRYEAQMKNPTKNLASSIPSVVNLATNLNASKISSKNYNQEKKCILCFSEVHEIAKCTSYTSPENKITRIKELRLCFKCLKPNHTANICTYRITGQCYKCKKYHWAFLCAS